MAVGRGVREVMRGGRQGEKAMGMKEGGREGGRKRRVICLLTWLDNIVEVTLIEGECFHITDPGREDHLAGCELSCDTVHGKQARGVLVKSSICTIQQQAIATATTYLWASHT